MPNHVTTKIIGPNAMLDYISPKAGKIDFNMLIPQPENIEQGLCPHLGFLGDDLDEDFTDKNGVVCWYHWNIANWGTKWNAYDVTITEHPGEMTDGVVEIRFDTAWSHPMPILEALSEEFPDFGLLVHYADEDLGYNLGNYIIVGGDIVIEESFEEGSKVARDFAANLKYGMAYDEWNRSWE